MAVADLTGKRVGRYQLTRHLASGGMAEIFLARQEGMGGFQKDLVLKTIAGRYADNPKVVGMFLEEARLAATLNHPNIVQVFDVGEEGGLHYMAMEYIDGETVTDIVRRGIEVGRFLPLEHAVCIISQAAEGLGFAHERRAADGRTHRIVHRDISPSNLIVSYQGVTKIVDFGIARAQDQIPETAGTRAGKISYMSPEQLKGQPADHRSDIFSLGVVLYEITLGRRLWKGAPEVVTRRIVEENAPPPTFVKRDYPPALELVILRALEKDPKARYQSALELHRDLDDFLAEAGMRTGNRRIADYLAGLFASDAKTSVEGVRQAREFAGEDTSGRVANGGGGASVGGASGGHDDADDLNFDRRPTRTLANAGSARAAAVDALPTAVSPAVPASDGGRKSADFEVDIVMTPVPTLPAAAPSAQPALGDGSPPRSGSGSAPAGSAGSAPVAGGVAPAAAAPVAGNAGGGRAPGAAAGRRFLILLLVGLPLIGALGAGLFLVLR